jgi:hypothetical protein
MVIENVECAVPDPDAEFLLLDKYEAESVTVLRLLLRCEKEQVQCAAAKALLDYVTKERIKLQNNAPSLPDHDPADMTESDMAEAFATSAMRKGA